MIVNKISPWVTAGACGISVNASSNQAKGERKSNVSNTYLTFLTWHVGNMVSLVIQR